MAPSTVELLEKAFVPELQRLGFAKRARTWHRPHAESTIVINIQASQWGDDVYINLGAYLPVLGQESRPPIERCHLRLRISPFPNEAQSALKVLRELALPLADRLASPAGIRSFLNSSAGSDSLVHKDLRQHLGLEAPA